MKNGAPDSTCVRRVIATALQQTKKVKVALRTDSSTVQERSFCGSVPINL